ncbi:MAG: peptidylprolyl isomerase [Myxococcota bacterium]
MAGQPGQPGQVVQSGKVVVIHYTLTGEDGRLIESTRGKQPLAYLHGKRNMIEGLERKLEGLGVGAEVTVTLPAADGYGERKGAGAVSVPRREFGRKMDLREGMPLEIKGTDGTPVAVWVTKIKGSQVWIDVDHPLAGQTLTFAVEILWIRDPYAEELEHGHAHGQSGDHRH